MIHHRRPTHYGQLLAYGTGFLFCTGEDVFLWRGVLRYETFPYIVSAILVACVVLFAFCAALAAVWTWARLAVTAAVYARRLEDARAPLELGECGYLCHVPDPRFLGTVHDGPADPQLVPDMLAEARHARREAERQVAA